MFDSRIRMICNTILPSLKYLANLISMCGLNAYNAAGMSRRQDKNVKNVVTNVNILEFGYFIWNPYEKCIHKSPNMPGIGSLICEIDVNVSEI